MHNINSELEQDLGDVVLSPESGIQRIRKILFRHRLEVPALFDLDKDGDEFVLPIKSLESDGTEIEQSMYIIYGRTEDGYYEFYAEMANQDRVDQILSDEDDTEETE